MEETSYVGLQRFCNISKHILPSAYTGEAEAANDQSMVLDATQLTIGMEHLGHKSHNGRLIRILF